MMDSQSAINVIKFSIHCQSSFFGLIAVLAPQLFQSCDFGPLRKKTKKSPPKFSICGSFGPQGQF